jgi:hypothetical protein
MQPLLQNESQKSRTTRIFVAALLTTGVWTLGCGGGGASSVVPRPPPPPSIQVSVTPASGSVLLGNQATFSATVTNTANTSVSWGVNGVAGGNATVGTISSGGAYTAPADLPSPASVLITATSQADTTKSGSATETVLSDIALALTPNPASVELGATQAFQAAVTSNGHPDTTVRWSASGAACASGCGAISANGSYVAPQILPSPASVTLTAQSVADPSKQVSAAVAITSTFSLQLSAPSGVPAGAAATVVATMTPEAGSNPSNVLTWSLSGPGCSGSSCGTLSVITSQSVGGNTISDSATYTAPVAAPNPNMVTVTVTPQADPTRKAQATLSIQPGVNVSLSPATATLAINHRVTMTAQVSTNTGVTWSVNGVAGGSASLGQICVVGSNPCQTVTSGTVLQADYLAPGAVPAPNPVNVTVTSAADATKSASAQITAINHVLVSVLPGSITLAPQAVQGFTASVLGASNQNVVWQIQGTACSTAGACGAINALGPYTAPSIPPTPDAIQVLAISSDDTSQSGIANVTISTGANILTLHPSSVYAGAAQGFTLKVEGSGFAASSPGPSATLLIAGTARTTTCTSTLECTAPVTAVDVAVVGSVSIQIQNPSGTKSSVVSLVVAAPNTSDEVIALSSSAPNATGKNIVVVDPTTAGVSVPGNDVDLDVAAMGAFSTANNSCALGGNPISLVRPASGTSTADICLFSESGLDTSMTYMVSGPGDITVISKQPAGLGIIHLTLQIPASAAPGARTLFIQNTNLDKTAASGALEVE